MDRVVVILGVGRVDRDERQVAPVLVMGALPERVDFFRLRQRLGPEQIGDVMGAQRDQADRLFALDGAETFAHPGAPRAEPRLAEEIDADEIAVARLAPVFLGDDEIAAGLLLVDGLQPSGAVLLDPQHAEQTMARFRQQLDDPSGELRIVGAGVAVGLGAGQRAVADAGQRLAGPGSARRVDQYARRRAEFVLVPLDRRRDQLAVGVAPDDVDQRHGGQGAGLGEALAALLYRAVRREFAQEPLQLDLVGALDAEGARDLALADLAGLAGLAHRLFFARQKCENVFARGRRRGAGSALLLLRQFRFRLARRLKTRPRGADYTRAPPRAIRRREGH